MVLNKLKTFYSTATVIQLWNPYIVCCSSAKVWSCDKRSECNSLWGHSVGLRHSKVRTWISIQFHYFHCHAFVHFLKKKLCFHPQVHVWQACSGTNEYNIPASLSWYWRRVWWIQWGVYFHFIGSRLVICLHQKYILAYEDLLFCLFYISINKRLFSKITWNKKFQRLHFDI